jgi:hypothetical protein
MRFWHLESARVDSPFSRSVRDANPVSSRAAHAGSVSQHSRFGVSDVLPLSGLRRPARLLSRQTVVYLLTADKYRRLPCRPIIGTESSKQAGSHYIPVALSSLVTRSKPAVRTHDPVSAHGDPVAPSPALSSSHLRWLRPRRHAEQEHLTQRPDVLRQARGHGGRPRLPALGRARAVGRFGV